MFNSPTKQISLSITSDIKRSFLSEIKSTMLEIDPDFVKKYYGDSK